MLGEPVRYDGRDKAQPVLGRLAAGWQVVPLCPELAAGFGVPRAPVDLVGFGGGSGLRFVDRSGRIDHSDRMRAWLVRWRATAGAPPDGAVLKARSPSCGTGDARRYDHVDDPAPSGRADGLFVATLRTLRPTPALISEGALEDPRCLARFEWKIRGRAAARAVADGRRAALDAWFGPLVGHGATEDDRAALRGAVQGDRCSVISSIDALIDRLSPPRPPYTDQSSATPGAAVHPTNGA